MATQLQIYSTFLSPFLLLWILMYLDILPTFYDKTTVLVGGPLCAVLALGMYAAGSVLYGVATFNDCAEAREELVREVIEAKKDLRRRKIID